MRSTCPDTRSRRAWLYYEECAYRDGATVPAGVDEVGRGCLAGPVVAAAVVLPRHFYHAGINDSKQLSTAEREKAYALIVRSALAWGLAMVEAPEIDRINILRASLKAMALAVSRLKMRADYVLIDGRDALPDLDLQQRSIIAGDGKCISIAAASILAKVTRDRMMRFYARKFPRYAFDLHKGYATEIHRSALKEFGPCALHRRSFAPIISPVRP